MSITVKRNVDLRVAVENWKIGRAYISDQRSVYVPLSGDHVMRIDPTGEISHVYTTSLNKSAMLKEVNLEISINPVK